MSFRSAVLSLLAFIATSVPLAVAEAGVTEEPMKLSGTASGPNGAEAVTLDALVIRPDDDKRHPLAVISHGLPSRSTSIPGMRPNEYQAQAEALAERGWTTVLFTRRGIGLSSGQYAEDTGSSCDSARYLPAARASASDIKLAIAAMRSNPHVDGNRIVAIGHSAGGLATVALTADAPRGLVAAINFAGGRRGGASSGHGVCNEADEIATFATLGRSSRTPMLWVYAENDQSFDLPLARRFHQAFTRAGGRAEFIEAASFGSDGHMLFYRSSGIPVWAPLVDDFLSRRKLAPAAGH